MSLPPVSGAGLPALNQALEPSWVRNGTPDTQKAYKTALAFEQTLVEQLARSLTATSGLDGGSADGSEEDGSASSDVQSGQLSALLPQALTAGVMKGGGLGLAAQLTHDLQGPHGAAKIDTSGGTEPSSGTGAR